MPKTSSTSSVTRAVSAENRLPQRATREPGLRRRSSSPEARASLGGRSKPEGRRAVKDGAHGGASRANDGLRQHGLERNEPPSNTSRRATSDVNARGDRSRHGRDQRVDGAVEEGANLWKSAEEGQALREAGGFPGEMGTQDRSVDIQELDHDLSRPSASSISGRSLTARAEVSRAAMVSDPHGRFDLQELRSVRVQLEHGVTMQFSRSGHSATARLQSKLGLGAQQREELREVVGHYGYTLEERGERQREGGSDE